MFHTILILMPRGRSEMSAMVITKIPTYAFMGIINTSPNLELIFVHK